MFKTREGGGGGGRGEGGGEGRVQIWKGHGCSLCWIQIKDCGLT